MTFNPDWPRFIRRAIDKHVKTGVTVAGEGFYIEGQERKTNLENAWYELRMDGPWSKEKSKDFWFSQIDVDVLCSCNVDKDLYHIDRMVGKVASVLDTNSIPVLDDSDVSFGCLTLDTTHKNGDGLVIHHFGIVPRPPTKLIQATVEAKYWINFDLT